MVHGGEFAVGDFSLDDAVGGDFRRAGEEDFVDWVGRVKVDDEISLVEENADFSFDDGVGFLQGFK